MSERDYAPLSIACVRGLCDKIYEKRKFAGVEIEKMVKDFNDANNSNQIRRLIRVLGQDLMASTNPNVKNGALMGLSSVAVGLGKDSTEYLGELTAPILACFSDGESRVRYQAAEALFNVLKIARGAALPHFGALFDALARAAADPEPQVRQAAELLDRLLKDIVTESGAFDVGGLVPQVRARLYSRAAGARQFAGGWLAALDAVPGLDLLPHLPQLLDGLFSMLGDPTPEIRRMCSIQLGEFLRSLKKRGGCCVPAGAGAGAGAGEVAGAGAGDGLAEMTAVLVAHAGAADELVQLTAVTWSKEFVELAGRAMLPATAGLLRALLPALAYHDEQRRNIRETAATVNLLLTKLVGEEAGQTGQTGQAGQTGQTEQPQLPLGAVVEVLVRLLQHHSVHTKVAALDWILHLYSKLPNEMCAHTESVFLPTVRVVCDPADDVVRRALAVAAEICSNTQGDLESNPYYEQLLRTLLQLLGADDALLEDRGAFIIRQLCVLLNAEDIYRTLSRLLRPLADLRLAAAVVELLASMLLTAAELQHLRAQLRAFRPVTHSLFVTLYPCWCHAPVALLALCLLTHNYAHCNTLISTFGDLEITVDFLTEVDKLVQLIESPIFAYLRLELLGTDPAGAELRSALYGLLMLLPQSEAFHALRRRLQCCPGLAAPPAEGSRPPADIDFASLLEEFKRVQHAHRLYKMADRRALADK